MRDPILTDLSDAYLASEFDRLCRMRDESTESINAIRAEQSRRKDAELERLHAQLDAQRDGGEK